MECQVRWKVSHLFSRSHAAHARPLDIATQVSPLAIHTSRGNVSLVSTSRLWVSQGDLAGKSGVLRNRSKCWSTVAGAKTTSPCERRVTEWTHLGLRSWLCKHRSGGEPFLNCQSSRVLWRITCIGSCRFPLSLINPPWLELHLARFEPTRRTVSRFLERRSLGIPVFMLLWEMVEFFLLLMMRSRAWWW